MPFSFSSAHAHARTRRGEHRRTHTKSTKGTPSLRTSLIHTSAGVDLPPLAVCVLSRRTALGHERRRREKRISDDAGWRSLSHWNACPWGVHALTPLVWKTARQLSTRGTGETVNLHFGGRRFTEDNRMKEKAVFLPSCSFLFQAPMPAHVAESTAEHTRRAQKELPPSNELDPHERRSGPPSACGVRFESPHRPRTRAP